MVGAVGDPDEKKESPGASDPRGLLSFGWDYIPESMGVMVTRITWSTSG